MLLKRINELNNSIDQHFRTFETALDWRYLSQRENYLTRSTDSGYEVMVALPGHNSESVTATIEKGTLCITAKNTNEILLATDESFKFRLPKDCETSSESIDATMENGILTVKLPKVKEIKTSSEIKIK